MNQPPKGPPSTPKRAASTPKAPPKASPKASPKTPVAAAKKLPRADTGPLPRAQTSPVPFNSARASSAVRLGVPGSPKSPSRVVQTGAATATGPGQRKSPATSPPLTVNVFGEITHDVLTELMPYIPSYYLITHVSLVSKLFLQFSRKHARGLSLRFPLTFDCTPDAVAKHVPALVSLLGQLQGLRTLYIAPRLHMPTLKDSFFQALPRLNQIQKLVLVHAKLEAYSALIRRMPRLRCIHNHGILQAADFRNPTFATPPLLTDLKTAGNSVIFTALPPVTAAALQTLDLSVNTWNNGSSACPAKLAECSLLTDLNLQWHGNAYNRPMPTITSTVLRRLVFTSYSPESTLQSLYKLHLTELNLATTNVTDPVVAAAVKATPSLTKLSLVSNNALSGKWATDPEVQITLAPKLTNLDLARCPHYLPALVSELGNFTALQVLSIARSGLVPGRILAPVFKRLTRLRWLSLSGHPVTSADLTSLASISTLQVLHLNGTGISSPPIIPHIMVLSMHRCTNLFDLGSLPKLTNLRQLELNGNTALSARTLTVLSRLPLLEDLSVAGLSITDRVIDQIALRRVPLKRLAIVGCALLHFSSNIVQVAKAVSHLTRLSSLVMGGSKSFSNEDLLKFTEPLRINSLSLWHLDYAVTPEAIATAACKIANLTQLNVFYAGRSNMCDRLATQLQGSLIGIKFVQ